MPSNNYRLVTPPVAEPVSLALAKSQLRVDINDDDFIIGTYISIAREWCEDYCNRAFFPQTWALFLDCFPIGNWGATVPRDQRGAYEYSAYWNNLAIRLPKPRAQSVTSFTYEDSTGTQQTLTSDQYSADFNSEPARLTPLPSATWPVTQLYNPGTIEIQFVAGSFANTVTETVTLSGSGLSGAGPFVGVLSKINLGITAVVDSGNNPLTYTTSPVINDNGNVTDLTQISFASNPSGGVATVTYTAGECPKAIVAAMLLIIGHLYEHREENSETALKEVPMGAKSFLKRHRFNVMGNLKSGY